MLIEDISRDHGNSLHLHYTSYWRCAPVPGLVNNTSSKVLPCVGLSTNKKTEPTILTNEETERKILTTEETLRCVT